MSRRSNPWPAFVDLFSALLVASFAGFILMASELKETSTRMAEWDRRDREMQAITRVRAEADRILGDLEQQFKQKKFQTTVTECGEDACLDLFIHYPRDGYEIPSDQRLQVLALQDACNTLRQALDRFPEDQRRDIEIIVEGHADRTPARTQDPKEAYLYNWSLSARRAASVLWEFKQCALEAPKYSIAVIGYADSERDCTEPTEECDQRNRRTTLRLRANTQKIAARLSASPSMSK